jgi:hypothetical protein
LHLHMAHLTANDGLRVSTPVLKQYTVLSTTLVLPKYLEYYSVGTLNPESLTQRS